MHEIIRHLYLGDLNDLHDQGLLQKYDIKQIVNLAENPLQISDIPTLRVKIDDCAQSMISYFPEIIRTIHAARLRRENVFVHCSAGMSRGPTAVLAYLVCLNFFFPCWNIGFMSRIRSQVSINPQFYTDVYTFFRSPERKQLSAEFGDVPDCLSVCNVIDSYAVDPLYENDAELKIFVNSYKGACANAKWWEDKIRDHISKKNN